MGSNTAKAKKTPSVVMLYLEGGASQLETFDPRPRAPQEFRSLFGAVKTALPGVEVSGLLPKLARRANKLAIVRSFTHTEGAHEGAQHWIKTGYPYPPEFFGKAMRIPDQKPAFGSIVSRYRGPVHRVSGLPTYVRVLNYFLSYHDGPAWLGRPYAPFVIGEGVNRMLADMSLKTSLGHLEDRRTLLKSFDRLDRGIDQSGSMRGMDSYQQQAVRVVLGKAKEAFDLSREDVKTREKYRTVEKHGPGIGMNLLLARRLCETGVPFVSLSHSYWDHHGGLKSGLNELTPPLDHAVSAFLDDVEARGLEKDILLVITSEFGRTPRIDTRAMDLGRDHWPGLNTLVFAGGGLRMGQVIGASDERAAYPRVRPIEPLDLMATLFRVLDIDPKIQYPDLSGRPVSLLARGEPIEELFS
jgi:hypothetical protein